MNHMHMYYISHILSKYMPISDHQVLYLMNEGKDSGLWNLNDVWMVKKPRKEYRPTTKQICIYLDEMGFSQQAIAKILEVKQPTVAYHLRTKQKAKPYVNRHMYFEELRRTAGKNAMNVPVDEETVKYNLQQVDKWERKHLQTKRVFKTKRHVYAHHYDSKNESYTSIPKTWSRKPKPKQ